MPTQLDGPESDEDLYLVVGPDVGPMRPIAQGDVFSGVVLPGFPHDDHSLVMLTTHPCSLRSGASLKPRLQAVPVRRNKHVPLEEWSTTFLRQMPLPALESGEAYAGVLTEASIVTPTQLAAADRIAVLSEHGTLLLQQRLVWALTHAVIELDTLAEFSAPAFAELELLEEWNELACAGVAADDVAGVLLTAASDFEAFIRESGQQARLLDPATRGDARKAIRDEARRRYSA